MTSANGSRGKIFSGKLHPGFWVLGISLLTAGVHNALSLTGDRSLWIPLGVGAVLGSGLFAYTHRHRKHVRELHKKGATVRKSEVKYRTFFENSTDAMLIIENGMFVDCNAAAAATLGYDCKEELLQVHPSELSPEFQSDGRPSVEKADEMIQKAMERGSLCFEWEHLREDGTVVPVEVSLTAIPGDGGTLLHTVWRDLSGRKLAGEALRKSELLLRSLIEAIPDLIWLKDPEGVYLFCNSKFERFFGAKASEIIGKTDYDFVDRELADFFRENDRIVMASGGPNINEEEVVYADDGHEEKLETLKTPVYAGDGTLLGVLGVGHDVTDRKRAEEAREQARAFLQAVIDGLPEELMVINRDYTIALANRAAREMAGEEPVSAGLTCHQLSHHSETPCSGEEHPCPFDEVIETRKPVTVEHVHYDLQNKEGFVEMVAAPIFDENGEVIQIIESCRDITKRKQAEEAREELEAQLRQAQKMEAVGQMAGGMAHDFNNLLQVISGYAELSEVSLSPDSSAASSVREIGKAASRAKELINQLLAFSRRKVICPEDLNLNTLIDPLLKMIRGLIGEHIQLEFIPGHGLGTVHADGGQIEQILMNLCVNARDAMPKGGTLTIETENVLIDHEYAQTHAWATEGRCVLLRVSDTGSGMDAETLEHVFEPFFTTKGVGEGSGLGLSMVFGIIEQHHGHVEVYSEVDRGTVFKIYLPVVERRAVEVSRTVSPVVVDGTETLLIAEDNEAVLELTRHILMEAGYTVLTAKDGKEAVRVFEEHVAEIDMVMFDVVMPRMGGKEAMKKILKMRPDLPHLFVSGYSENAVHTNFIQNRDLHLLSKPYQTDSLLRKVREVLEESGETGGRGQESGVGREKREDG